MRGKDNKTGCVKMLESYTLKPKPRGAPVEVPTIVFFGGGGGGGGGGGVGGVAVHDKPPVTDE